MHLIETYVAKHRLQQRQAKGCRYWAWPYHSLGDLAWVGERKVARIIEPSGQGAHPFPPKAKCRLTVDPPEHIERWAAVGVGGQDIPQQPHLYRCWIRC